VNNLIQNSITNDEHKNRSSIFLLFNLYILLFAVFNDSSTDLT